MIDFQPKYITFDCYGTLTRFRMPEMSRELFADRIPAEGMDRFIRDFSAFRFDEVLGDWKPYADVLMNAVERTCRLWKIPFRTVLRHSPTFLKLYRWRFLPNLKVLDAMERAHPEAPHYYLEIIGTDPQHQGKGYGTALIAPMVDRADDEGVGMYLESSKESNVPYYARFGFEVTRTLDHGRSGRDGPRLWLMWRDPR